MVVEDPRDPLIPERSQQRRGNSGTGSKIFYGILAILILAAVVVGMVYLDRHFFKSTNRDEAAEPEPSKTAGLVSGQILNNSETLMVAGKEICHWEAEEPDKDFTVTLDGEAANITWKDEVIITGEPCNSTEGDVVLLVSKDEVLGCLYDNGQEMELRTIDEFKSVWTKTSGAINKTVATEPDDWTELYKMYDNWKKDMQNRTVEAPGVEGNLRRNLDIKTDVYVHLLIETKEGKNLYSDPESAVKYTAELLQMLSTDLYEPLGVKLHVSSVEVDTINFIENVPQAVSYLHTLESRDRPKGSHILLATTTRTIGHLAWPGGVYNGFSRAVAGGLDAKSFSNWDRYSVGRALAVLFGAQFSFDDDWESEFLYYYPEETMEKMEDDLHALSEQLKIIGQGYSLLAEDCPDEEDISISDGMALRHCMTLCDRLASCKGFSYSVDGGKCIPRKSICDLPKGYDAADTVFYARESLIHTPDDYIPKIGDCAAEQPLEAPITDVSVDRCAELCDEDSSCRGFSFQEGESCVLRASICDLPVGKCDRTKQPCFFQRTLCEDGLLDDDSTSCCDAECGMCGGDLCMENPAGARSCCMSHFRKVCDDPQDTECILRYNSAK